MKTIIATLALALTSVNAASLRSRTGLSRSDTSIVNALANKYDCNTAGNTLVDTIKEIETKHDDARTKLTKTCADNKAANALAENTASGIKDTCLADHKNDPEAAYQLARYGSTTAIQDNSISGGFEGIKTAVHLTQDGLVRDATKAEADATQPSDDADSAFTEAEGVYNGALKTRKELMDKFDAARPAAENAIGNVWGTSGTEIMSAHEAKSKEYERGAAARATAEGECDNIFDKRMEGINADDAIVVEIRKLVNDLTDCDVPATTGATTIDGSFIEMKAQAKCAVAQEKATVFLQERLHVDVDVGADTKTITENFSAYVDRIKLETAHAKAEKGKCYDAALKLETDAKSVADTAFGTVKISIEKENQRQTDALDKEENDLDTTTASAVSDAKTPWETTQSAKKSLNKVLADATAAKITTVDSAKVAKKLADDKFEAAKESALVTQNNAIAAAKASCDDAWKIAQDLKTTNDKANEESCDSEHGFLDTEKVMIEAINGKVEALLSKFKGYKTVEEEKEEAAKKAGEAEKVMCPTFCKTWKCNGKAWCDGNDLVPVPCQPCDDAHLAKIEEERIAKKQEEIAAAKKEAAAVKKAAEGAAAKIEEEFAAKEEEAARLAKEEAARLTTEAKLLAEEEAQHIADKEEEKSIAKEEAKGLETESSFMNMTKAQARKAVQGSPAPVLSASRQKVGKSTWNTMSWAEKYSLVKKVSEELAQEEAARAADESPAEDSDTKVVTKTKLKPLVDLPDISFTNNKWTSWKAQGDPSDQPIQKDNTILIDGNKKSRVRTTRLTVDMPAKFEMGGEGNLYFLADVIITGATCPENNPYKRPKMIISEGTDEDIMINSKVISSFAFKYRGWADGTEQTGGAVVSGWKNKMKKKTNFKLTLEFVLHQCTGTMFIKNPRLLQVAPVQPVIFPFTVDPTVGVEINLKSGTVKPVNMKLFGANSQFAFSKVGGYESDNVQQLLEKIRQPEIRFPGGKASNFYDWETGMLIDDTFTKLDQGRAITLKRKINWHFDEFCESLKKTEGSMTYVMNVIRDRSLKNCQDELRKVLSCGATIDLIELGNENMYKKQSYSMIGGNANAFEYTKWVRKVAAALREVKPDIKLTVPAAHHWNQWNDDMGSEQMKQEGIFWDDMVMHPYVNVGSPIFNTGAMATLLSAPAQFEHMLKVWDNSILKDTKLAFTEWGLNYEQETCPWGKSGTYAMTLLDAAIFIKILNLGQTGQVVQASRHILVTQASHGLYQYAGNPGEGKYVKTVNGAYFSKFIDVARDSQSLAVQTVSPELTDHVKAVTSAAFKQKNGNYKVLVVNTLDRAATTILTVGTSGAVFTQCSTSSFSEDIGAYPLYDLDEDPFSIGIVTKCSEVSVPAYSISVVTMLRKKQ